MQAILGIKKGMTQIFDPNGEVVPVTVVEAGPCYVSQIKTEETDGYRSVQLAFAEKKEKRTSKAVAGHLKKASVTPKRYLREFKFSDQDELEPGQTITVERFKEGQQVVVSGTSKGKGFQGVVKRHGFRGGPVTHGQSDRLRAPGSLGQSSYPSRVFKGLKMAGRMGGDRVTVKNVIVVKVDTENNLLYLKGAVPGSKNSLLEIRNQ